jgi:hypothetical protein
MDSKANKKSSEYQALTGKTSVLLKNGCNALAMVFDGSKLPVTTYDEVMPNMATYAKMVSDTVELIFADIEKANNNPKVPKSAFKKLNEIPFVFVFLPTGSECENDKTVKESFTIQHHVVVCHLPKDLDGVTNPGEMLTKCYLNGKDFIVLVEKNTFCVAINKVPYSDYFKDADVVQARAHAWFKEMKLFPEDEEDDIPFPSLNDLEM